MIYDAYLGAVGSIFLLNAVQWSLFRDWIYGLFTFQTLLWFSYALLQGMSLTQPQGVALHAATNGLIVVSYLELVHRLFGELHPVKRRLAPWFRWVQLGLFLYLVLEVSFILVSPEHWLDTLPHRYLGLMFWSALTLSCAVGIWVAAGRRDAIGRFFIGGSILLLLNEAQIVYYYLSLFLKLETYHSNSERDLAGQIIVGGFIVELLCFSLCLVFRQRQLAVAQAVEKARTEDQLVQERLETELSVRRLEQEKTDVQLRALQAQVNPHFLFNSLNSLSSLIEDEPERAGQFVDQLSLVYRYLLKANDQPLTTVASELDFIKSYYHLLKTRYGAGLDLAVNVEPQYQTQLLPPLTLQLLVENAVKHNVTSPKRPLAIAIFTDTEGHLIVQNNLQRKNTRVLSNGVGLSTITTQYQKLQQSAPLINEDNNLFSISLPLIKPAAALNETQYA
ncbi:hypothetical protein GCM10027341_02000 [Spirosoma knui]